MRLWHKDLLPYLPMQQMVSQWRECCAIVGRLNGPDHSPNHVLVNKITDYDPAHFNAYTNLVIEQFNIRGYSMADKPIKDFDQNYKGWVNWLKAEMPWRIDPDIVVPKDEIFKAWMNKRYLRQCYYNLEEKFDCGGIPEDEWDRVIKGYVVLGGGMK